REEPAEARPEEVHDGSGGTRRHSLTPDLKVRPTVDVASLAFGPFLNRRVRMANQGNQGERDQGQQGNRDREGGRGPGRTDDMNSPTGTSGRQGGQTDQNPNPPKRNWNDDDDE